MKFFGSSKLNKIALGIGIGILLFLLIPSPAFKAKYATVLESDNGSLLGARTSADGMWRFPIADSVPRRFIYAITTFEDRYFFLHPGINPFSLFRAVYQNQKNNRIVSGGSTLTMQVVRMSRGNNSRTFSQKLIEMVLAIRLELTTRKKNILRIYAAHAPFGGNVVGLEAASWRYFGRPAYKLSWAETATLAVLPNAPSLIYPGKNQPFLLAKRNRLLKKMYNRGLFDYDMYQLSIAEPLPNKPEPLPAMAPHLLNRLAKTQPQTIAHTHINENFQIRINQIISAFDSQYKSMGINNISAIVVSVRDNKVIGYVGNSPDSDNNFSGDVDVVAAPRSSGSILKPLLYAASLTDATIYPTTLLPDVPSYFGSFTPKNFNNNFDGIVPANQALVRSLNVPFVHLLQQYGQPRFYYLLRELGFSSFVKPADYYGLSIILGGGEVSLFELASVYSSFAQNLIAAQHIQKQTIIIQNPALTKNEKVLRKALNSGAISSGAIFATFNQLTMVNRPDEESGWEYYGSSALVAWKTGTSFGFRDGWAVGVNPDYCVAVWVGNADGKGVSGLTGTSKAAPVMFRIFDELPSTKSWFDAPKSFLQKVVVCSESGFLAGPNCNRVDTVESASNRVMGKVCPYHRLIHLSLDAKYRVSAECVDPNNMKHQNWFVLPPGLEYFYMRRNSNYKPLPPYMPGCAQSHTMQFIYPDNSKRIFIPRTFGGKPTHVVFEIAHSTPSLRVFWYVNTNFISETKDLHQIAVQLSPGKYTILAIDETGSEISQTVEVENAE